MDFSYMIYFWIKSKIKVADSCDFLHFSPSLDGSDSLGKLRLFLDLVFMSDRRKLHKNLSPKSLNEPTKTDSGNCFKKKRSDVSVYAKFFLVL